MANTMALESAYVAQLNPMEQKILKIASEHLETSFSLKKSIGYQEWQEAQKPAEEQAPEQIQEPKVQIQEPKVQPKKLLIKRKIKIKSIPS